MIYEIIISITTNLQSQHNKTNIRFLLLRIMAYVCRKAYNYETLNSTLYLIFLLITKVNLIKIKTNVKTPLGNIGLLYNRKIKTIQAYNFFVIPLPPYPPKAQKYIFS